MFNLPDSLSSQILGITRDTFSGVSGFAIFIIAVVLGFFIIEVLINLFKKNE